MEREEPVPRCCGRVIHVLQHDIGTRSCLGEVRGMSGQAHLHPQVGFSSSTAVRNMGMLHLQTHISMFVYAWHISDYVSSIPKGFDIPHPI